jgi:hypothetical protein
VSGRPMIFSSARSFSAIPTLNLLYDVFHLGQVGVLHALGLNSLADTLPKAHLPHPLRMGLHPSHPHGHSLPITQDDGP